MTACRNRITGLIMCCLTLALACAASTMAAEAAPSEPAPAETGDAGHTAEILEWRRQRHERLSSEDGWLTLVGLEWLQPGRNRVGSGADKRKEE